MKIRYGVSRRDPTSKRYRIEAKNGCIDVPKVAWHSEDDHKRIRAAIKEKHPGWLVSGYCKARESKKEYSP